MIIKKLSLKNFQSHLDTQIVFDPHFNCIVGPSNVGKTAIFNALRFALLNEWENDFFSSFASPNDVCVVAVEFSDGTKLIRTKGKSINKVEWVDPNGIDSRVFQNFGNEYPPDITSRLRGMVDDVDVCFAQQDSNSFLIYETPSVRGQLISQLSGIGLLDVIVDDISNKIRQEKVVLQNLEDKKKTIDQELQKYANLNAVAQMIDKYESLCKKLESWEMQYQKTVDLHQQLEKVNLDIQTISSELLKYPNDFRPLLATLESYEVMGYQMGFLNKVETEIQKILKELELVESTIARELDNLEKILQKYKLCPVCGTPFSSQSVDFLLKGVFHE